ncbi:MAG: carbamoyltransferase HypF [Promethearchaeota archaeon]
MSTKTVEINITGIVQGVGFRPFLFNLARDLSLKGYILNRGNAGVRLVLQGKLEKIEDFIKNIEKKSPQISFIESLDVKELESTQIYNKLRIKKSEKGRGISLTLPPDIAICNDCLKEMRDPKFQKYYKYPFIACAVCGPRYTTVKKLPYDRERTTMSEFPLCDWCTREYSDFNNRRFHAQTFACSSCGPNYKLFNKSKEEIKINSIKEIFIETAKRINEGEIAAIKGIGGVHLVCLASENEIVLKLRKRKGARKYKPFALMVPNLKIIENFFNISKNEYNLLTSYRRPIVLLEKKRNFKDSGISDLIAPGLNNVGFMLPYSGIHYLLFDLLGQKPLIYTSGNKSNIPMGIEDQKIFSQLENLADFFLLHNRTIYQRADDSVLRVHDDKVKIIRRSRGYIPEYLPLPFNVEIPAALSTGPELANTGAILRHNRVFPTQHIGNVTSLETFEFLKKALSHIKNLLKIKENDIKFITCDLHPAFITTRLGKELSDYYNVPLYSIQHHFAHILGLMAENKIEPGKKIIGISTDGVGYGDDGNVWGGEILLSSYEGYKRLGHLEYQPMIGGDRCTKFPARMVASIILNTFGAEESIKIFKKIKLENDLEHKGVELNAIISQFTKANNKYSTHNIPLTSSTGRIFDTVSYLIGASNIKTYRGEPAMRLEGLASKGNPNKVNLNLKYSKKNGIYIINTSELIRDILELLETSQNKREDIAAKFQIELGRIFAEISIKVAEAYKIDIIGLTGGVAYNYQFSKAIKNGIYNAGLKFIEHDNIPPGDAGISTGQLVGGIFKHKKIQSY